jgi:hypothetical protein
MTSDASQVTLHPHANMPAQRDFLREAKIHELLSAVFGWLWIASSWAFFAWLFGAIFAHWSWWAVGGLLLLSAFLKLVASAYRKEAQQVSQAGIEAGQLYVDHTGQVHRCQETR